MIKIDNGERRYFDRNGVEITAGCKIKYESGRIVEVYVGDSGYLCTDATNPRWIQTGRARPLEYGLYPLTLEETNEVEVVEVIQ